MSASSSGVESFVRRSISLGWRKITCLTRNDVRRLPIRLIPDLPLPENLRSSVARMPPESTTAQAAGVNGPVLWEHFVTFGRPPNDARPELTKMISRARTVGVSDQSARRVSRTRLTRPGALPPRPAGNERHVVQGGAGASTSPGRELRGIRGGGLEVEQVERVGGL